MGEKQNKNQFKIDRRKFLSTGVALLASARMYGAHWPIGLSIAENFEGDRQSLALHKVPEWFRNAKFGISAHWTPQSVPEQGDWYAQKMYIQGSPQYNYHVANYGHPSKFGYKDFCHLWKGEAWNPEGLIDRYKRAGARYFVALANHHDGFDCWDSKYQAWNSVNMGPRKDIVGTWAEAARSRGMRFGVSVFSTQNWEWFNVSHGHDKTGPYKGVPYDGNLTKEDGKGKWWEGLDPQMLYCPPHADNDPPSEAYVQNFYDRTKDLIDTYHPDQVFFTDNGLPLGKTGLELAAYFYNTNALWHDGQDEAVINTKNVKEDLQRSLVWDRLPPTEILPFAWQMDICIGDWHYKRGLKYRPAADVIPYLVDVVSKNGNLLLNIPIRADGSIDDHEIEILDDITNWMEVNGDAIFDTRPWKVYGEGPTQAPALDFPYVHVKYTAQDIRFTAKGDVVYAIALDWPNDGALHIKSLGLSTPYSVPKIARIEMLGSDARLKWKQEDQGLVINLPTKPASEFAHAFRIHFV